MDIIDKIFENNVYLLILAYIVMYTVPKAINYWNTTEFENLFMTYFDKIRISFTKMTLVVLIILGLTYIQILTQPDMHEEILNDSKPLIEFLLTVGLFLAIVGQVSMMAVLWIDKKLSPITYYNILLDNEIEWKIEKMSNNNCLIVYQPQNPKTRIMLEDWKGKKIVEVRDNKLPFNWLYKKKTNGVPLNLIIVVGSIITLSLILMIFSLINENILYFLLFLLGMFGLMSCLTILKNYKYRT